MKQIVNHKTPAYQEKKKLKFDQISNLFKYNDNLSKRKSICVWRLLLICFCLGIVFMSTRHMLQMDKYKDVKNVKNY